MRTRILQEHHGTPLGRHFGRHKKAALVRLLAYWPGRVRQTRDFVAYVRSCEVCQRTKACCTPFPLPSRRSGVIGVDWLLGLPMPASGFDQARVHIDHLPSKVHAVATRSTDTAGDAARITWRWPSARGSGLPTCS